MICINVRYKFQFDFSLIYINKLYSDVTIEKKLISKNTDANDLKATYTKLIFCITRGT